MATRMTTTIKMWKKNLCLLWRVFSVITIDNFVEVEWFVTPRRINLLKHQPLLFKMSLMNYLGAVASAAVEAATAAAIQQQSTGPTTLATTHVQQQGSTGPGGGVVSSSSSCSSSATSRDGPTLVSAAAVPTPSNNNNNESTTTTARASVAVPQGLSGFPVVPITIHHSSGPTGPQFAYAVQAIPSGSMRLAHSPHGEN